MSVAVERTRRRNEGTRDRTLTTGQALVVVALAATAAAVVHVVLALELPAPWSLPDELIYSELAKSLGDGLWPSVRDEPTRGYGVLYPLLIAPAWAAFSDPSSAYVAAKVINGIAMGLAAFPAFFLAVRFVSVRSAIVVSAFSVFVPSMLYAGSLLVEVVLYPVFLLALLGIVAAVQRPTRANQLLAVGGIGLACLAKPLAVALVPAYLLILIHLGLVDRLSGGSARARLRAHSTALGLLGGIAVVGTIVPALLGDPTAVLGSYGVVLGHVDLSGTVVWLVRHMAALDLYVGIAPFAASLVIVCVGSMRGADRRTSELAAVLVWACGGLLLAVAAYASKPLAGGVGYAPTEARLHERNMFVLVPLLLVGLALYFERGRPGGRKLKAACLAVAVLLPALLPLERLLHNANLQALAVIPWSLESIRGAWPATLLPLAVAACLVLVGRRRTSAGPAWALVGLVFGVTTLAAHGSQVGSSVSRSTVGVGAAPGWIDDAVPRGAEVLALWVHPGVGADLGAAHRAIWMNEFYNRSVGRIVEVGAPMPYSLPHVEATLRGGILTDGSGSPVAARYVLAPCWTQVRASVLERDPKTGARLYLVPSGQVDVAPTGPRDASCTG